MRPGASTWHGNAGEAAIVADSRSGAQMVYAQWPKRSRGKAELTVVSQVTTRNLAVDLSRPDSGATLAPAEIALYTASSRYIPTGGIVKQTADKATAGAASDLEKLRKIYEWIVVNTSRNPKTRGCGLGDISFLLESGDFTGKCADINGLAVGLARASGIPARDLYGIRVAPSELGYTSLGANGTTITKAQHCRAEAFVNGYGWIPLDPADVRKVMLEEPPGKLSLNSPKVIEARGRLFGSWEGNYMVYNDGHDVKLPGSNGDELAFLMYPQAEVDGQRLDSLDAATFVYEIAV
ncbi:MAG TPA: transglutaminase-like domain-containing protein [Candidatus Cybelea sp.]|jgi:transglutaminase-like putative cysteine protease|nr:transglutaminase-like domain-containing protein [Candidatus Cybelea sp.]